MKKLYFPLVLGLVLVLAACSDNDTSNSMPAADDNQQILGVLSVHINVDGEGNQTVSSTSFEPNTALAPQAFTDPGVNPLDFARGSEQVFYQTDTETRYINVDFTVTNNGTEAGKFFLLAVDSAGMSSTVTPVPGTPFYNVTDYNNATTLDATAVNARNLRPFSTQTDDGVVGGPLSIAPRNSFQDGVDTSSLASAAQDAGLTLLDFGYGVLSSNLDYVPIDAGGTGQVTISTAYETVTDNSKGAGDPASYSMRFAVVEDITSTLPAGNLFAEDFNSFTGTGFAPEPTAGQLDSDVWVVEGLSDGEGTFGGEHIGGDFARGTSSGAVITGGIYAFEVAPGDYALGVQPGGSDMTPGTITLKYSNTTGSDITNPAFSYDLYVYNDQGRASSWKTQISVDGITYQDVPDTLYTSTETADANPQWQKVAANGSINGTIPTSSDLYIRFLTDDVSGSGQRDEFALDNVVLSAQ